MEIVCKSCPYNDSIESCKNKFKELPQWRFKEQWFDSLVYCPVWHPEEIKEIQSKLGE